MKVSKKINRKNNDGNNNCKYGIIGLKRNLFCDVAVAGVLFLCCCCVDFEKNFLNKVETEG